MTSLKSVAFTKRPDSKCHCYHFKHISFLYTLKSSESYCSHRQQIEVSAAKQIAAPCLNTK